MEWARARLLEYRLRAQEMFERQAGARWLKFQITYPGEIQLWLQPADAPRTAEAAGMLDDTLDTSGSGMRSGYTDRHAQPASPGRRTRR